MTDPTVSRYLLGVAGLLITFGALGYAAVTIRRRYLPDWFGAIARLAEAVTAFALLTLMLELLGAVGLFSFAPVVVAAAVIVVVAARLVGRGPDSRRERDPRRERDVRPAPAGIDVRIASIVAVAATAAVFAEWGALTLQSYDFGIRTFDSVWYHLPWAASFAQTGHVTPLLFTDVEYLTQFYPATSELFHGLGIVLFARDTVSPGLNLVWLALVLLAGYCIGRARGVGALALSATAVAMAVPAVDISQAGSAANDVAGMFFVLASVALILHAQGRRYPFALAAASAGLAVGVKLSMVAPVVALSIGAIALARRGRRGQATVLWLVALFVAGGFWYVRNLIDVGNPFPWLKVPGLTTPAPALQQHTGFSVVHYLTSGHAWTAYFQPGLASGFGPWWYLVVAAVIAGPVLCLLNGADRTLRMLALVALASLLAYMVTPETAAGPDGQPLGFAFNLRYAAPVLALSLALLPLAPILSGTRRRVGLALVFATILVATMAQAHLWPSRQAGGAAGIAAAVLLVAAIAALSGWRPRPGPRSRVLPAAAAAMVLVVLVVAAYPWQRHYLHGRYAFQPGVSSLARVWAFFRQVHRTRVAVVGTFGGFFSYPLSGIDDSDHVQYVGMRGANGSFAAIRSCAQWRDALNAGHFRYVVTTPARDPWHPKPLHLSPEGRWTARDPAAHVVYTRRATGQRITIYELSGPLDPSTCA